MARGVPIVTLVTNMCTVHYRHISGAFYSGSQTLEWRNESRLVLLLVIIIVIMSLPNILIILTTAEAFDQL